MFSEAVNQQKNITQSHFECLTLEMVDITGDGGIRKNVVKHGEVHYSFFLDYADQPFDTTFKFPRMVKLGRDVTLLGLELGLLTMKKGEFAQFLLQPKYAYGEMGCPPRIPPAATILYEVEVIDFFDSAQVDHFLSLAPDEQNALPLSMLTSVADTLRKFGNRCFSQGRYDNAKDRYKQTITVLMNRLREKKEEERTQLNAMLLLPLLNRSLTELHLHRPRKALKYATRALDIEPNNTKALFRCGQAYMDMHDYEEAQKVLIMAQVKKPHDCDINNLLHKVAICYKKGLDQQREVYSRMFKAFRSQILN